MVNGLALAETTPGPLIMVVQIVGSLGAHRHPGTLNPWAAGILGATLVVWVTFDEMLEVLTSDMQRDYAATSSIESWREVIGVLT